MLGELALRLVARLALEPQVAARAHDAAQDIVRQLYPANVEALLDAQQPAIDECGQRLQRRACRRERLLHALFGEAFAVPGFGQQVVFDELTHAGRLIGERALVELGEDRVVRSREEVNGDLGATLRNAGVVELAADQTQQ
ncbi:MAG: hypothetical protein E6H55_18965 [Betaproteobacteria bacterium]|nr:MAG: hypothetical protein E6H55_18965 [Betaproteobacteria bacterium]